MDLPIALKCTERDADGKLVYAVPRTLYSGRVLVWYSTDDRTAFYDMWRTSLSLILERDMSKLPLTWTITTAKQMAEVLETYPAGDLEDDAILAELQRIGADIDALVAKRDAPNSPPTT